LLVVHVPGKSKAPDFIDDVDTNEAREKRC
jgi:hypothetical protein